MDPDARRRQRGVWTAGSAAAIATVITVWTMTLWPGSAVIAGVLVGTVVGLLYGVAYDFAARR